MSNAIIEVEHLSKLYELGTIGTRTLRESLQRRWYRVRGREHLLHKFGAKRLMIGPDHPQAGPRPNTMWALKDVSFTVGEGEVLGLIGRNGAGKSTLLKLLTRITEPTSGRALIHGRVASLLEVGTGFHPELTGRENIYLNGAILGMKKAEIARKFDEIVAFSEVEQFIDTPVKRYSSGMYVRLAFAVAAHLEPEILLVDEVLAVGDAAFQRKCLGKMQDTATGGRTVIFVSHNMGAIGQLCRSCVWLDGGGVQSIGPTESVVSAYLEGGLAATRTGEVVFPADPQKLGQVRRVRLLDPAGRPTASFTCDAPITVEIVFQLRRRVPRLYCYFHIAKPDGSIVLVSDSHDAGENPLGSLETGQYVIQVIIPQRTIGHGEYVVGLSFSGLVDDGSPFEKLYSACSFVLDDVTTRRGNARRGYFSTLPTWRVIRLASGLRDPDEVDTEATSHRARAGEETR